MDYTFLANLQQEFTLPEKGILSHILHKDDNSQRHPVWLRRRRRTLRTFSSDTCHSLLS